MTTYGILRIKVFFEVYMVFVYVFAIIFGALALTLLSGFAFGRISPILSKASALILGVVAFFRCMLEHEALFDVIGRDLNTPFDGSLRALHTVFALLLVWFTYAALLTIVLDQFFDFKTLKNITRFFSTPIIILDVIFLSTYATAIVGRTGFDSFDFRLPLIAAELALALFLVFSKIKRGERILPVGKEWLSLIGAIPLAVLAVMPSYVPQVLFGFKHTADIAFYGFSEPHRLLIYAAFIIPFLLFHLLRNKNMEAKRLFLIYITIGSLWSFLAAHPVSNWIEPWNWPLHLCTLAMFTIPLSIIFKWEKLCHFSLYVSVVGALFMMLFPNIPEDIRAMNYSQIAFWMNHYIVFGIPMLLVALGVFKRPTLKEWLASTVIFTGYFITVLILNSWFANYFPDVDFFFLNGNYLVDMLGEWAKNIKSVEFSIPLGDITLKFYPLYQLIFYVVYLAISALMWLCFRFLFTVWDNAETRRQKERDYKIMNTELKKFFGERAADENYGSDREPAIVLRGFSKKYGKNKHYSVDRVSFKVKGGEIFGFLGPNGAGKSTIIKSIVGIQTITSGNIEICGYDVERQSVQSKLNTGYVPDHYALYENLTGREYINFIADLYDVDKDTRDETIEKYVKRFQLTGSFDNQMKTYSHGMKQKIAIMAALVHNPKVWILDEPLTGLDPNSIHEVKECMKEHAAAGNIVFFSSHLIDIVENVCDKIVIIKKGKLRAAANVSELSSRKIDLEEFYLDIIGADENAPLVNIGADDILDIDNTGVVGGSDSI